MDFGKISDWIGAREEEMVDLQGELTARPALAPENGGSGEWAKAAFLEGYLRDCGLDRIEHFDCPDNRVPEGSRPNFVATIPGKANAPAVWALTHIDVVPPGDQSPDGAWQGWESDPWTVRRAGDEIVGRGVSDDQQAVVSSIFAARALVENGAVPPCPVKLLFVSDEETSSRFGLHYLLGEHADLFSREDLILVPDSGNSEGTMIEVAEKSLLWLEVRVRGRQAHASRPDRGVNAFRAGAELVNMLHDGLRSRFDRVDHLYDLPQSSFEPTRHAAGVPNVNTIPAEEVFCFDCRVLPSYDLDSVMDYAEAQCRRVDGAYGTETRVKVLARQDAPPPTPVDAPVVRLLDAAIREVRGVEPMAMGIGGQTVSAPLRAQGFRTAVWMTCSGTAHQVNETCRIADMVQDARVFAHVFLNAG